MPILSRDDELTSTRTYQIFRREIDNTTLCVESVKGLRFAQTRVQDLDATSEASHFIFDPIAAQTIEADTLSPGADPLLP